MLLVEKVDKDAELTNIAFALRVPVFKAMELIVFPRSEEAKSCCELRTFAVAVLTNRELVSILNVEIVLGRVTNPPPVVTPTIDDAYKTSVLMTPDVTVLAVTVLAVTVSAKTPCVEI